MRAESAVGDVELLGRSQQDTRRCIGRVAEDLRAAHGNFSRSGDNSYGVGLRESPANEPPRTAGKHCQAGERECLGELPAGSVLPARGGDGNLWFE
jgi:hypothetical protein